MTDPVDFKLVKARRETNCTNTKPEELLAMATDDVAKGVYANPKRMMIIIVDENSDGSQELFSYRSAMNRAEEVGYLELAKVDRMKDWMK